MTPTPQMIMRKIPLSVKKANMLIIINTIAITKINPPIRVKSCLVVQANRVSPKNIANVREAAIKTS